MEELKKFLEQAVKAKASDLHLVAGAVAMVRVHREIKPLGTEVLTGASVQRVVNALLTQNQLKELVEVGDVDVGSRMGDVNIRVNIHQQANGYGLAIRLVPSQIPTPEALRFEKPLLDIVNLSAGFVVISGPTGSGKSTTMACLIQTINTHHARLIVTLEDPIEYRFKNEKSLIEQRQMGTNFPSFQQGLRHVLRQDPDVIVVGEMRDPETISLALTAAETGHLVISTLHAPNAAEVIERIVNVFEGSSQQQILVQLSATLHTVVAQHLLSAKAGGVIAAREILLNNLAVQHAIRSNNLSTIRSAIQTGKKQGMISMAQSTKSLKEEGFIL
ncbi:PilT/PilU family type 4a pilus ATPase [Patescibacteria group bacterium]|nr:MAG: PilT/PilU family type 4a pilus ATPase [Patescibacteria group bacterium]